MKFSHSFASLCLLSASTVVLASVIPHIRSATSIIGLDSSARRRSPEGLNGVVQPVGEIVDGLLDSLGASDPQGGGLNGVVASLCPPVNGIVDALGATLPPGCAAAGTGSSSPEAPGSPPAEPSQPAAAPSPNPIPPASAPATPPPASVKPPPSSPATSAPAPASPTSAKPAAPSASAPAASSSAPAANGGGQTVTRTVTVTSEPTAAAGNQCNTGPVQCCNSVQSSDSSAAQNILGPLGIALEGLIVPVGLTCTPINVLGAGGGSTCTASPVCCENNTFNGLIAIGCTPININL